ncbi:hypothetical protein AOQ84DRAFT_363286 [Glonium stellatum]|uniref:DUF7730 domain-containing protein n=1 Tax=Glonium stellatum TaxID=574774 RepID=A0A8E2JU65_9PEZI|nr:hypothetical protein AOQ84DRAFT_363286 [Glonium stellatum]
MNAEEPQSIQGVACGYVRPVTLPPSQPQRQSQDRHLASNRTVLEGNGEYYGEYHGELRDESEERMRMCGTWPELPNRLKSSPSIPYDSADDEERTGLCSSCSSRQPRNKPSAFPLFSLPTHIRQQIYSYILTDLSTTRTLVHISRAPRILPSYKVSRPRPPKLLYHLDPAPREPFTTSLLLASRELYHDALPVLYAHKTFYPRDLEGLLPLFLNNLSPFARQSIRRIRLSSESAEPRDFSPCSDRTKPTIQWAITCAQVATLNATLHGVEVCGRSFLSHVVNRPLLYPLCKIKASKILVDGSYASFKEKAEAEKRFEELLWEASERLKAAAKRREESTQAEADERARRREMELAEIRAIIESQEKREKECRTMGDSLYVVLRRQQSIENDPAGVKGLKQFEAELEAHREKERIEAEMDEEDEFEIVNLPPSPPKYEDVVSEEWDVVSTISESTLPLGRSSTSDDEWQDTASTLAETVSGSSVDSAKTNDVWEDVEK